MCRGFAIKIIARKWVIKSLEEQLNPHNLAFLRPGARRRHYGMHRACGESIRSGGVLLGSLSFNAHNLRLFKPVVRRAGQLIFCFGKIADLLHIVLCFGEGRNALVLFDRAGASVVPGKRQIKHLVVIVGVFAQPFLERFQVAALRINRIVRIEDIAAVAPILPSLIGELGYAPGTALEAALMCQWLSVSSCAAITPGRIFAVCPALRRSS